MTENQAESAANRLEKIKRIVEKDREYATAAYLIEMAQLEISLVLAKHDNEIHNTRKGW